MLSAATMHSMKPITSAVRSVLYVHATLCKLQFHAFTPHHHHCSPPARVRVESGSWQQQQQVSMKPAKAPPSRSQPCPEAPSSSASETSVYRPTHEQRFASFAVPEQPNSAKTSSPPHTPTTNPQCSHNVCPPASHTVYSCSEMHLSNQHRPGTQHT